MNYPCPSDKWRLQTCRSIVIHSRQNLSYTFLCSMPQDAYLILYCKKKIESFLPSTNELSVPSQCNVLLFFSSITGDLIFNHWYIAHVLITCHYVFIYLYTCRRDECLIGFDGLSGSFALGFFNLPDWVRDIYSVFFDGSQIAIIQW